MLYRLMIVLLCTLVVLSPAKAQTIVAVLEFIQTMVVRQQSCHTDLHYHKEN